MEYKQDTQCLVGHTSSTLIGLCHRQPNNKVGIKITWMSKVWGLYNCHLRQSQMKGWSSKYSLYVSDNWPFKPQYPHTNSPDWLPYFSLWNQWREFVDKSQHSPLGVQLINSLDIFTCSCIDIVRRKLMLATFGTWRVGKMMPCSVSSEQNKRCIKKQNF